MDEKMPAFCIFADTGMGALRMRVREEILAFTRGFSCMRGASIFISSPFPGFHCFKYP